MTLRLIDDDDSMASNPEPPDLDQRRRGRGDKGDGYWRPEWVAGRPPAAPAVAAKVCRECRELSAVLHQDPRTTHPERVICGVCQGKANRDRMPTTGGAR